MPLHGDHARAKAKGHAILSSPAAPADLTALGAQAPNLQSLHFHQVEDLPPDALELLSTQAGACMQSTPTWYRNFAQTLGDAFGTPGFAVLRKDERTMAVLPYAIQAIHWAGNDLSSLTSYYSSLYCPAFRPDLEVDALRLLIGDMLRRHGPVARLRFSPMDPSSREFVLLRLALIQSGLHTSGYFCFGNWYLPTEDTNWAEYLASRRGEVRSTVRRMARRFERMGGRLELITGGERLKAGIEAYQAVYNASWKQSEPFPEFVTGLMHRSAEMGWLRLGVAWLQERPIAAQIWTVFQGRAEIFKLAYEEGSRQLSPGTLITAMLMEHVIETDRVKEVDYLTGDDAYKADWMTRRRERWGLVAYNLRTPAGQWGCARQVLGQGWRALKGSMSPRRDTDSPGSSSR